MDEETKQMVFTVAIKDPDLKAKMKAYETKIQNQYGIKFNRTSFVNTLLAAFFARLESEDE